MNRFKFINTKFLIVSFVGILSIGIRLYFVYEIRNFKDSAMIENIAADSYDYLHLARNMVNDLTYSQSSVESRWVAFFRPPGYPLFCAVFEYLGMGAQGIIIAQAILSTFIPITTTLLIYSITQKPLFALSAGLLSGLSPTGIGLNGVILADMVFAVFFCIGFALFFYGVWFSSPRLIYVSGFIFGISALTKPVLFYWPLASILLFLLLNKAKTEQIGWRHLYVFISIQLIIITGWCMRNYLTEGVFSVSSASQHTLRYYLATEVEASAANPSQIQKSITSKRNELVARYDQKMKDGDNFSTIINGLTEESFTVFRSHPFLTLKYYFLNIMEHLSSSWDYLFLQYPIYSESYMFEFMYNNIALDHRIKKFIYILQTFLLVISVLPFGGLSKRELWRRFSISLVFLLVFLYFVVTSGITFWTGPRIIYPAEFSLIILFIFNLQTVIEKFKKIDSLRF